MIIILNFIQTSFLEKKCNFKRAISLVLIRIRVVLRRWDPGRLNPDPLRDSKQEFCVYDYHTFLTVRKFEIVRYFENVLQRTIDSITKNFKEGKELNTSFYSFHKFTLKSFIFIFINILYICEEHKVVVERFANG